MTWKSVRWIILLGMLHPVFGQGIHSGHDHEMPKDTNTLGHFFEKGRFYGHARSFFSSTVNQGALVDSYAQGIGAGIGYETPIFLRHFQVGLSGFFMFNLFSSDLAAVDPTTGQGNRYEVGLFDIQEPNDHEDLDRLEELFVKVHLPLKTQLTIGRQVPNMPFVNPQDGRMRPTLIEAVVLENKQMKGVTWHGSYVWRISPRSTVEWFTIGESIGIYPSGVFPNGRPASFHGSLESKGIFQLGLQAKKGPWRYQIWDTFVENILHTQLGKLEYQQTRWLWGAQLIRQQPIGHGGVEAQEGRYIEEADRPWIVSGRVGYRSDRWDMNVNATHIGGTGRYLLPREWGREPFYTFMARERNEGMGGVTAVTTNLFFKPEKHIRLEVSTGYFHTPDVKNFERNKYGLPSYVQTNVGLTYQFDHFLKGLTLQTLIVRKDRVGETYENPRFVFNKVEMTHLNFILNYHY